MSEDTAITTSQTTESNSIAEAYQSRHDNSLPESAGEDTAEGERKRPRTLADLEDEIQEESRQHREKREGRRPHVSLSDAYSGTIPEEEELLGADGLPESLQGYPSEDIEAAMYTLGLNESDLEDPRWV